MCFRCIQEWVHTSWLLSWQTSLLSGSTEKPPARRAYDYVTYDMLYHKNPKSVHVLTWPNRYSDSIQLLLYQFVHSFCPPWKPLGYSPHSGWLSSLQLISFRGLLLLLYLLPLPLYDPGQSLFLSPHLQMRTVVSIKIKSHNLNASIAQDTE